jgi:hypothetical protein
MKIRMNKVILTFLFISLICPLISMASNNPRPQVVKLAMTAYRKAVNKGLVNSKRPIVTIIDYSLPSNVERLWVLDTRHQKVIFHSLVAHGKGSGDNLPTRFSNSNGTLASSLGVFLTENTYIGKHGYSLRIKGLEKGFNDHAEARAIVIHSAWYVNKDLARSQGRIGRSWGCPAVDTKIAKPLIDTIKDRTIIVAYANNNSWLSRSHFIN